MSSEKKIFAGIFVFIILIFAGVVWLTSRKPVITADPLYLYGEPMNATGNKDAKVRIVEFGDYQCPACAIFDQISNKVVENYKDPAQVSVIFKHFVLSQHTNAQMAAQGAEAAGLQGKYWLMHDLLYQRQADWEKSADMKAVVISYARELKLNIAKFTADLTNQALLDKISKDNADAASLGLNSTPTVYINNVKYLGGFSTDELKKAIDAELAK